MFLKYNYFCTGEKVIMESLKWLIVVAAICWIQSEAGLVKKDVEIITEPRPGEEFVNIHGANEGTKPTSGKCYLYNCCQHNKRKVTYP